MADQSGAHSAHIPLSHYKAALRLRYGPGRWRIERDGTIRALAGSWIVFGRVGDPRTVESLFGRPTRQGAILRERWANLSDVEKAEHVRRTKAGMARAQKGVVAVEAAIIMSVLVVALVGGCTTVDNAIRTRWPGVGLVDVTIELVDFAAVCITLGWLLTEGVTP